MRQEFNKDLNIKDKTEVSPDGGTTFISNSEEVGGISRGDGGSLGIKPSHRCEP